MSKKNRNKSSYKKRTFNTREQRSSFIDDELMVFSFKDMIFNQPKDNEQSFKSWQELGMLSDLNTKVRQLCKLKRQEAERQKIITVYGDFPESKKTDFELPKHIDDNVAWAVVRNVGGQKARLVGYMIEDTFYAVFLDKDHQFFKSKKKNT